MSGIIARAAWAAVAIAFVAFVTQPIGIKLHFAFSIVALALMVLMSTLKLPGMFRHAFLALASVIVLRYVYWRLTETIPSPSQLDTRKNLPRLLIL